MPKETKGTSVVSRLQFQLPRTLADDFRKECAQRKLSHHGVVRDLILAWVSVNKPGCIPADYRKVIEEEVKTLEKRSFDADQARKNKLTPMEKRIKAFEKLKEEKAVQPSELSLLSVNPHDKSKGFLLS